MKPGDYDAIYSEGVMVDYPASYPDPYIPDYEYHEDNAFLGRIDYSDNEYDLESLEDYEYLVPESWVAV